MYWFLARYGILFAVGCAIGWTINGWRLNASISDYKASIAASEARTIQEYRRKEQSLQEASNRLRKAKDNEIKSVTSRLNATIDELRQRQDRQERTVSNPAGTCSGATGAELSKQDAEFLARLAAEADKIVVELNQCIQQYRSAR